MSDQKFDTPPPGWYVDPGGSGAHRWWSGAAWTDYTVIAQPLPPRRRARVATPTPTPAPTAEAPTVTAPTATAPTAAVAAASVLPTIPTNSASLPDDGAGSLDLEPEPIRNRSGAPARARWGVGSIISILLALAAFIVLAFWLSPWWLLLPVVVFLIVWLTTNRGRYLRAVQAKAADPILHAHLLSHVKRAAAAMGIPAPELYVSPQPVVNAFALTDRGGGVVVIFQGLLDLLDDDEVAAVLAHEVGHIKNRDSLYMVFFQSVRISLAIVITVIALILALCIALLTRGRGSGAFAGMIAAGFVIMGSAIAYVLISFGSRSREYGADRHAAETHSDPLALGRALTRMEQSDADQWQVGAVPAAVAARCIVRPFASGFISELVASHPTRENRIARIERMVGPAELDRLRRDSEAAAWRRAAHAHDHSIDIAQTAEPAAFPADVLLPTRPGELLWISTGARFVEPSRSLRAGGYHMGAEGRLLITTHRAVFLSPAGRTEWKWSELTDRNWLTSGAGSGSILMLGVSVRQRNSGVWVDRSTARDVAPYVELAIAAARGRRDEHLAQLRAAAAAHERQRPHHDRGLPSAGVEPDSYHFCGSG